MSESENPLLTRQERQLLLLLGTSVLFNRYCESLLSFTLVQIQDELALPESQLGVIGSIVELGAVLAVILLVLADRLGRRRLLTLTLIGGSLLSTATAFVGDVDTLIGLQLGCRIFVSTQLALALVIVVEELRPICRGFGVGVLGTFAIVGHGLAMIGLGVIGWVPGGWRGLFALSALALLLAPPLWLGLRETRAFERLAPESREWFGPVRSLVARYPQRCVAVAAVTFLWSFSNQPVDFFLAKLAQDLHGMSPEGFATLAVLGGLLGLSGQVVAGWVSDRSGRRPAMLATSVLEPCAAIALYTTAAFLLAPIYVAWIFASVANDVLARTTSAELFPTSARATSAGLLSVVAALGAALGLACEAAFFDAFGSHWTAVRYVTAFGFAMAPIVWLAYPETRARALEEISPESGVPPRSARTSE